MVLTHQPAAFYNDANSSNYYSASAGSSLEVTVGNKADASAVYTKTAVDNALGSKANTSDIPDISGKLDTASLQSSIDGLERYALASDVSAKANSTDVDTALALKANSADVYSKTDVDADLATKASASALSTAETNISALQTATANLASDESAISSLQSYNTALKLLIAAIQNQVNLKAPDATDFDYSSLLP